MTGYDVAGQGAVNSKADPKGVAGDGDEFVGEIAPGLLAAAGGGEAASDGLQFVSVGVLVAHIGGEDDGGVVGGSGFGPGLVPSSSAVVADEIAGVVIEAVVGYEIGV